MKLDWDSAPTWPLHLGLYVLAGFVVVASMKEEIIRQSEASSLPSVRQQLIYGAIGPATAGLMRGCEGLMGSTRFRGHFPSGRYHGVYGQAESLHEA